jgi:pilus assembly protein CpaC
MQNANAAKKFRRPAPVRNWPLGRTLMVFGFFSATSPLAMAQQAVTAAVTQPPRPFVGSLTVSQGSGELLTLKQPVSSLFAADPSVIEVHPASPTSIFVFGKGVGETSVVAADAQGNEIAQYTVSVTPSHYAETRVAAQSQLAAPGGNVTAESESGGMIIRGTVETPEDANNIINQAKIISPAGTVINQLQVSEPVQVELKVRIAYMSRNVTRQLGVDWGAVTSAGFNVGKFLIRGSTATESPSTSGSTAGALGVTFPGGTFEGVIDALASDNLAHIVAEPTLTTLSGTQASFLVGGQFPIPVAEDHDTITIEFKSYGVQLVFTPTVFSDGRISLQVSPTLSQLSNANSVTESAAGSSSAITVPSLIVQQASSTVILGSGQGMALAGLLEDQSNQTNNAVPGIGELPVLGALFRGDSFQREQQELVITVTPYLVNPVDNPGVIAQPDDGWTPPNDLQRILLLRDSGTVAAGTAANAVMPADSGFMVQ